MARTHISQREARRLRRRVQQLEQHERIRRNVWGQDYHQGVEIATATWSDGNVPSVVRTVRRLRHAVVVVGDETDTLTFIALPHPKDDIL